MAKRFRPARTRARKAPQSGSDSSPPWPIRAGRLRIHPPPVAARRPAYENAPWSTVPGLLTHAHGVERSAALAAFLRVFNLKTIAIVFYFSVLVLLGSYIISLYFEPFDETAFRFARSARQNLITGLMLLFGMGVLEALLAVRPVARRSALLLGVLTSVAVTMASIPVRILVIESPLSLVREEPGYFVSMLLLWSSVGSIGYWLFRSLREDQLAREELADAECARETLNAQMVEARLSALQAQIEPHFLFNTLANVKRLYETAPHKGREMLSSLISYLRAALPSMRQSGSTLGRELDLARSFLTILKMRMGDRLDFSIHVDPAARRMRRCRRWCCRRSSRTRSSTACRRCPKAAASTSPPGATAMTC